MKKNSVSKTRICLAATTGGHFEQISRLMPLANTYDVFVLTNKCEVSKTIKWITYRVHQPCMKNRFRRLFGMIIVLFQSIHFLRKYKPDVIISSGSGEMYPLLWAGKKLFKKKIIFIESYARITEPSQTGLAVYKFADRFIVQWESMLVHYKNAEYLGGGIY